MQKTFLALAGLAALAWSRPAGAATPFPLGVYSDSASGYASFATTMKTGPAYFDAYIDFRQPVSAWPSSAAYGASVDSQIASLAHAVPVIGLNLYSAVDQPDADYKAFVAGRYDAVLDGIVAAWLAHGYKTQVYRLGWEMNIAGPTYAGKDAQSQADWVAAFQHIAGALRASGKARGAAVQIAWNPAISAWEAEPSTQQLWPGPAAVDVVAVDVYADCWPLTLYDFATGKTDASIAAWSAGTANRIHYWNYPSWMYLSWLHSGIADATGGHSMTLQKLIAFAKAQGKPLGIAETGAGNSGQGRDVQDDPAWPQWLAGTLSASGAKVAFVNIWDSNSGGSFAFGGTARPKEAAAWAKYFGASS